jgi:hypothetical protein
MVLKPEHLASLGISLPTYKPGAKVVHSFKVFTIATGNYVKHHPAITVAHADHLNNLYEAYNGKLAEARNSLKGRSSSSKDFHSFPNTWAQLATADVPKNSAKVAEQLALEKAGAVTDHPITALLDYAAVEPREAYEELVQRPSLQVDGAEHDVGIAYSVKTQMAHERTEPGYNEATKQIKGSELLAPVNLIAGGAIGAGCEVISPLPANPRFLDGVRCAKLLETFSQFRVAELLYEYVPDCPTPTAGGFELTYVDDSTDMIVAEAGFPALRDGFTRAGNAEFSVWEHATCSLHFPQQKWYYTGGQTIPGLEIPGMINLLTLTDQETNGEAISFGFLAMHYGFDVRSTAIPGSLPQQFYSAFTTIDMAGLICTINTPLHITPAASGLTTNLTTRGVIYGATIVSHADGAGTSNWRQVFAGEDDTSGLTYSEYDTNTIFWRVLFIAGTANLVFFPTYGDALLAETYEAGGRRLIASATNVIAGKSFAIQNVTGSLADGSV